MHFVIKKNGDVRIVSDQRHLNDALIRPVYPMTSAKTAVLKIPPGASFFSTLDASSGYWQVALDKESQLLTTFSTPWGRFAYTRGTMGLAPAGDEYNRKTDVIFEVCSDFTKIVDDICCFGQSRAECVLSTVDPWS